MDLDRMLTDKDLHVQTENQECGVLNDSTVSLGMHVRRTKVRIEGPRTSFNATSS